MLCLAVALVEILGCNKISVQRSCPRRTHITIAPLKNRAMIERKSACTTQWQSIYNPFSKISHTMSAPYNRKIASPERRRQEEEKNTLQKPTHLEA